MYGPLKSQYKLGENIPVVISLTNTTDQPQKYCLFTTVFQSRPQLKKDGQLIPYVANVIKLAETEEYVQRCATNPARQFYELQPQATKAVDWLTLSQGSIDWYGTLPTGHYELILRRRVECCQGPFVESDKISFEVAAYRFSTDGGRSFPLCGTGVSVPTLREVFEALPRVRFNIEPKQGAPLLAAPLCRLIRERGMTERVMVASFSGATLQEFRRECPEVATSAATGEVAHFLALQEAGLAASYSPAMQALQVPVRWGALRVLTRDFVEAAHGRGLRVHAWTINDEGEMRRLVDMGVDGIMTDYPDRLLRVLGRLASD